MKNVQFNLLSNILNFKYLSKFKNNINRQVLKKANIKYLKRNTRVCYLAHCIGQPCATPINSFTYLILNNID